MLPFRQASSPPAQERKTKFMYSVQPHFLAIKRGAAHSNSSHLITAQRPCRLNRRLELDWKSAIKQTPIHLGQLGHCFIVWTFVIRHWSLLRSPRISEPIPIFLTVQSAMKGPGPFLINTRTSVGWLQVP